MPQSQVYSTVPLTLLREGIPISHWTVYGNAGQPSFWSVVVKSQPPHPPTDKALPILYTAMHLVCCVHTYTYTYLAFRTQTECVSAYTDTTDLLERFLYIFWIVRSKKEHLS